MRPIVKQTKKRSKKDPSIALTFTLAERADSAHVFLDDGNGQPGGFAFSKVEDQKLVLSAEIPAGKYAWKLTTKRGKELAEETEGTVVVK